MASLARVVRPVTSVSPNIFPGCQAEVRPHGFGAGNCYVAIVISLAKAAAASSLQAQRSRQVTLFSATVNLSYNVRKRRQVATNPKGGN